MFSDNVRRHTIYVGLLNEGTLVWRPAAGLQIGQDVFVVLATGYDPATEDWEFPPGSIVVCRRESRDSKEVMVAVSPVDPLCLPAD
jgi:hypothetical protein